MSHNEIFKERKLKSVLEYMDFSAKDLGKLNP